MAVFPGYSYGMFKQEIQNGRQAFWHNQVLLSFETAHYIHKLRGGDA